MWPFTKRVAKKEPVDVLLDAIRDLRDEAGHQRGLAELYKTQARVRKEALDAVSEMLPLLLGYVTNLRADMITPSEAGKELTMIHARLVEITTGSTAYIEKLPKPRDDNADMNHACTLDALPLPAKLQR